MNLMRQRDDLKAACEAGALSEEQVKAALESPVFCWRSSNLGNGRHSHFTEEEWEYLVANIMEEEPVEPDGVHKGGVLLFPKVTPYECFRISYTDFTIYEQWWIGKNKALCFHCDEQEVSGKPIKTWLVTGVVRGSPYQKAWVYIDTKKVDLSHIDHEQKRIRVSRTASLLADEETVSEVVACCNKYLSYFLFEIMSNQSVTLRVRPHQPNKSVQWHQAREHYLVVHQQKAQQCQTKLHGISDHDLIRGAHWRRAHLRRLCSEKFRNKKGQLVPVRKAWVGPTEWQGHDNKIYKVVNLTENQQTK